MGRRFNKTLSPLFFFLDPSDNTKGNFFYLSLYNSLYLRKTYPVNENEKNNSLSLLPELSIYRIYLYVSLYRDIRKKLFTTIKKKYVYATQHTNIQNTNSLHTK